MSAVKSGAQVLFTLAVMNHSHAQQKPEPMKPMPLAGADEQTPSRAHYFSWINQLDPGPTESQTLANLGFFKFLKDEYGMHLDIYALDEGTIDHQRANESMESPRFKALFPGGFEQSVALAKSMGTRLGVWSGPDGFGDTPEEEKARTDMFVKLCRDYNFYLFKFDSVRGTLREEKQAAFAHMLKECRKYCPDLIVLNHRLKLGIAEPLATTSLWEGQETYIDVKISNQTTGSHNRVGALSRGLPPNLTRLVEDHGVCLSSCLDYWEDDLILQAFNRSMILAPEIYGDPWFLRDDELPKLARIYNLHRRYGDILVNGMILPDTPYGPKAVSRGDDSTRFLTLRNLTWNPVTYTVKLDSSIGLTAGGEVYVREFHPLEKDLGTFPQSGEIAVEVPPFRSLLLMASAKPIAEIGVAGSAYEILRDTPDKPVLVKLLGLPGTQAKVRLLPGTQSFSEATLDGKPIPGFAEGKQVIVDFPGTPLKEAWHRKLGDLQPADVPADAEALYEATVFAADNDALANRSVSRSGPTTIPQVQAARDAFFNDSRVLDRGVWSGFLFDDNPKTFFRNNGADKVIKAEECLLRLDFGAPVKMDRLVVHVEGSDPRPGVAEVSADRIHWIKVEAVGVGKTIELKIPTEHPVRYARLFPGDWRLNEVEGYLGQTKLDRAGWRASNLFWDYSRNPAVAAWSGTFTLPEVPPGSYLCVAFEGKHGKEGAYAAARMDGKPVGSPTRAPSMPYNIWETGGGQPEKNSTSYILVTAEMAGKSIDVVALTMKNGVNEYQPQVWITAYPDPYVSHNVVLQRAAR